MISSIVYPSVTQPFEIGGCPNNKRPKACKYKRHGKRAGCQRTEREKMEIQRESVSEK